jgi:hypothetical protein
MSDNKNNDIINKASHYNVGGIECIDVMEAISTKEEFCGFLKLNAFKYLYRSNFKGKSVQDLKKGLYYYKKLVEQCLVNDQQKAENKTKELVNLFK